jgi:hypothetical protein
MAQIVQQIADLDHAALLARHDRAARGRDRSARAVAHLGRVRPLHVERAFRLLQQLKVRAVARSSRVRNSTCLLASAPGATSTASSARTARFRDASMSLAAPIADRLRDWHSWSAIRIQLGEFDEDRYQDVGIHCCYDPPLAGSEFPSFFTVLDALRQRIQQIQFCSNQFDRVDDGNGVISIYHL